MTDQGEKDDQRLAAQLTLQAAHAEHTAQRNRQNMILDHTWGAAQLVLKSAFTLNGAALVAILALIGSVIQHGGPALPQCQTLLVLALFAGGIFFATGAAMAAYFSQSYHFNASVNWSFNLTHPFLTKGPDFERLSATGGMLTWLGVGAAGISFVLAVVGCFQAAVLMSTALPAALAPAASSPPPASAHLIAPVAPPAP